MIEGTLEQVLDAMRLGPMNAPAEIHVRRRARKGASDLAQRQKAAAEARQQLRAAFDLIRSDPEESALASNLARALGGSAPITETLLETASQIIAERKSKP